MRASLRVMTGFRWGGFDSGWSAASGGSVKSPRGRGSTSRTFPPRNGGLAGSGLEACGVGCFPGDLVVETAGLPGCEAGKFLLDVADVLLDRDGFQGGLVGGEFGFLCGAEGPGRKECRRPRDTTQ